MSFGISPSVTVREVDASQIIPLAVGTNAAFAGQFPWGPVGIAQLTTSEANLIATFGRPKNAVTGVDYLLAVSYLAYSSNLYVSRVASSTTSFNAVSAKVGGTPAAVYVPNPVVFQDTTIAVADHLVARYPGDYGNSIRAIFVDTTAQYNHANFDSYRSFFTSAPGTSTYVEDRGRSADEMHIVVIDVNGKFTGVPGQVLETFPFVSKASDAKGSNGVSIYYRDVLNTNSSYVYVANVDTGAAGLGADAGEAVADGSGAYASSSSTTPIVYNFTLGADGTIANSHIMEAYDVFGNVDLVDVSLVIGGTADEEVSAYLIQNIAEVRKDCVAFISPPEATVVNQTNFDTVATNLKTYANTTLNVNSSYGFLDSGWKLMYDKYGNAYRWIPLNADIAGLCARTDRDRDPWWSPGGLNRGQIKNVVRLAWSPNEAQRDVLYPANINPVVSLTGRGTVLFGDKTLQRKNSAFDRINVRRLFIVLEKLIANAAEFQLFEFNDEFTRGSFIALVEPLLREVQGRRGIQDFSVVCDESNNTAQVVASNQFKANILIKPNYSINYIELTFTAVGPNLSFDEVA